MINVASCRCLVESMSILMADRSIKKIRDIRIGDCIFNEQLGSVSVINILTGIEESIYCMCLEDGSILKATKGHVVLTDSGLKPMKDIRVGDIVRCIDGLQAVQGINEIIYDGMVYNLELESESHLMICEGIFVGDLFAQQTFLF